MKNKIETFKIGDYVKVKKGILDPDEGKYNLEIDFITRSRFYNKIYDHLILLII